MLRPRPIWIESRVPARLNCRHCRAKDRALLNPDSVENNYHYQCEVCGGISNFTLADLNDAALTIVSVPPKRISA